MIKLIEGKLHYYDKNGHEIKEGDLIQAPSFGTKKVYLTDRDELGTDATNPSWIESGRAAPCEYGIYPLTEEDTNTCAIVSDAEGERITEDGNVIRRKFSCEDLSKFVDSMLFDAGTVIAEAEYKSGDNVFIISLEVNGDSSVNYKGITYDTPSEYPDELIERILHNPGRWDLCSPSGENNDEPESDVFIKMGNCYKAFWEYRGCKGSAFYEEAELSSSCEEDVKEFFDEIARSVIGKADTAKLKKKVLETIESLDWNINEDEHSFEISQYSPAGEDFSFTIFCVDTDKPSQIADAITEYYDDFDPEEHTLMVCNMAGSPGLRVCLDDADKIDEMLKTLSYYVEKVVEDWCLEYGLDNRDV